MPCINVFPGLRYPVGRPRDDSPLYFEEVEADGRRWYRLRKDSDALFPVDRESFNEVFMVREAILYLIYGY